MKIVLVSKNKYLWQKIRLLRSCDEVVLSNGEKVPECDRLIWDEDSVGENPPDEALLISKRGSLSQSFTEEELTSALGGEKRLALDAPTRTAMLDGLKIKFSELEFSLLWELFSNLGSFVSREELIKRVWGESGNDGLINVYVHYLREKLENGSQRFIFSSRKEGYKLDVSSGGTTNARN